jgi:hypothetical protein
MDKGNLVIFWFQNIKLHTMINFNP